MYVLTTKNNKQKSDINDPIFRTDENGKFIIFMRILFTF